MRAIFNLLAVCVGCGPAIAQMNECQTISDSADRLACYDKIASRASGARNGVTSAVPSQKTPASRLPATSEDPLAVENAQVDGKIKSICRGC